MGPIRGADSGRISAGIGGVRPLAAQERRRAAGTPRRGRACEAAPGRSGRERGTRSPLMPSLVEPPGVLDFRPPVDLSTHG